MVRHTVTLHVDTISNGHQVLCRRQFFPYASQWASLARRRDTAAADDLGQNDRDDDGTILMTCEGCS